MLNNIRNAFPILQQKVNGRKLIYLDNAATTQKPQRVIDAIGHYYATSHANVGRSVHYLADAATNLVAKVRGQVVALLQAKSVKEVIFTPGATAGLNLIAFSYGTAHIAKGDEILVSAMEHHSNLLPWQALCVRKGAILKTIPVLPSGDLDQFAFQKLLTSRTKLVALTYVSNVLGTVNPLQAMIAQAHAYGAVVVVDAAQAIAHIPIDVQALGCDFLVFSAHKAYGPTGIGVLYGKKELLATMLPYQLGGGMVQQVSPTPIYETLPHRFEAGTLHLAGIVGLGAAIDFLHEIGYAALQQHEADLLAYAKEKLKQVPGLSLLGEPRVQIGIISFTIANQHPLDIGIQLSTVGIALRTGQHCAAPLMDALGIGHTIRVSLAIYNTLQEIDQLVAALLKSNPR